MRSYFPDWGLNPGPHHWKHRVLRGYLFSNFFSLLGWEYFANPAPNSAHSSNSTNAGWTEFSFHSTNIYKPHPLCQEWDSGIRQRTKYTKLSALLEVILYWFNLWCLALLDLVGQVLMSFLCTVFQSNASPWLPDLGFILGSQFVQTSLQALGNLQEVCKPRRPCC